jgi:hypothetical protein
MPNGESGDSRLHPILMSCLKQEAHIIILNEMAGHWNGLHVSTAYDMTNGIFSWNEFCLGIGIC